MLCVSSPELRCEAVLKCSAVVHVESWSFEALQGLALLFLPEQLAHCAASVASSVCEMPLRHYLELLERHLELLERKKRQNSSERQLLQAALVKLQAAPELLRELEKSCFHLSENAEEERRHLEAMATAQREASEQLESCKEQLEVTERELEREEEQLRQLNASLKGALEDSLHRVRAATKALEKLEKTLFSSKNRSRKR